VWCEVAHPGDDIAAGVVDERYAGGFDERPLGGAARANDIQAMIASDLRGRDPDASSGRVDQYRSATGQVELVQRVEGGRAPPRGWWPPSRRAAPRACARCWRRAGPWSSRRLRPR
jgi:hypothetical protein